MGTTFTIRRLPESTKPAMVEKKTKLIATEAVDNREPVAEAADRGRPT